MFTLFIVLSRANLFTLFLCHFSRANVFTLFMVLSRANLFTLFYVIFSRANVFALFFFFGTFTSEYVYAVFMLFFSNECVYAVYGTFTSEYVFAVYVFFPRANVLTPFMILSRANIFIMFLFFFWVICSFLLANMFPLFMAPYISRLL